MARIELSVSPYEDMSEYDSEVAKDDIEQKTLLTVIVPVTKMAGKLTNLSSWLSTIAGLEIRVILIHDFQDIETSKELNELVLSLNSHQISLIENYCGAPGLARNLGLPLIDSEWCCFWDSDDIPDAISALEMLKKVRSESEVLVGNYSVKHLNHHKNFDHQSNIDLVALNPGIWRIIFKSNLVKRQSFSKLMMGEDQIFLLDIGLASRKIEFSDQNIYTYIRGVKTQLSSQSRLNTLEALSEIRTKALKPEFIKNRFFVIVFSRMFLSSLGKLQFRYPVVSLLQNIKFLFKLPKRAIFFTLRTTFLSNRRYSVKVGLNE